MPPTSIRRRLVTVIPLVVGLLALAGAVPGVAAAADIAGTAYKDTNRDGVKQADETALTGKRIYLFNTAGQYLQNAPTDSSGRYALTGLADGDYEVRYGTTEWWELWRDWVPTTTGSEWPRVEVQLSGNATVDFGWRPIVRSTSAPIATYVAPNGLRIESYNDVVEPERLYDALMVGTLHGAEQPFTTIRFDYRPDNFCDISAVKSGGTWGNYRALCYVAYIAWLDSKDTSLFHEYGHAWSQYYAHVVQQDPALTAYLEKRGLTGDPRLRTSSTWNPSEMIAEDYRQLFGSANAAAWPQDNQEIPPPSQVPGLREFLSGQFMEAPVAPSPPATLALHVSALQGQAAKAGSGWNATATPKVVDAAGQPVAGVLVDLRWTNNKGGSGQLSCTTGSAGTCSSSVTLTGKVGSVTFTVTSVAKAGTTYDSQANTVTSVTLNRPR